MAGTTCHALLLCQEAGRTLRWLAGAIFGNWAIRMSRMGEHTCLENIFVFSVDDMGSMPMSRVEDGAKGWDVSAMVVLDIEGLDLAETGFSRQATATATNNLT
jgi:hypothetical protein